MSFTAIRPYFRARLNALGEDLREWTDGFNFENIPQTIQNKSYHIESGPIAGNDQNQTVLDATASVTVRVFINGYRDPADAIDKAMSLGETIVCDTISPVNANASGSSVKDVNLVSMSVEPFDDSNDNGVILSLEFDVRIFLETI